MAYRASWWHRNNSSVTCDLCFHHCTLEEGQKGICGVRMHQKDAGLVSLNYGLVSSIAIDPVEKKPLYHWNPGTSILSLGSIGCNMYCPFCQNWQISTCSKSIPLTYISPSEIVDIARRKHLQAVSFTYNEPFVWYEYILDSARALKKEGFSVVLVSNGMVSEEPLNELLPYIDAANIDVKAFDAPTYSLLGGDLTTVKNTVESMVKAHVHVELTSLIVPGIHKDVQWLDPLSEWASSLSPNIVLHISRYFPCYKWHEAPTPLDLLEEAQERAKKHLSFVYLGNVQSSAITFCPLCGSMIMERRGYNTLLFGLDKKGNCAHCGNHIVTLTE
ncbi:MAG: AmmeMemoRadiSam system radical SAM enzyme [Aminobacterium sp.]|uniref:AmmeMemoRadiSam system radical SAM enzyme n=1 Tax=Aminobacterium sp. TaxID=1872491 RepID=UPI001BD0BA3E|nr:AmmeMemoRadiSam system radical SAM enzyme [Aminobacterium sp.]MDD2207014.1 AmmeMemoRadiSam system radical SAM enzyme [Aminobacterium sp.]MDD4551891.1 AmmeMemoRadiSam system radical SAM enzyme [Aminobacterium sp.]MEA4876295.1 AmmeMemoRadiSam system radical SAM enzyme [Aminobacterium sp.]